MKNTKLLILGTCALFIFGISITTNAEAYQESEGHTCYDESMNSFDYVYYDCATCSQRRGKPMGALSTCGSNGVGQQ